MLKIKKGKKPNMDGIKLLVSILVCYPEIGTVSYEPREDALHFSFALKEVLSRETYENVGRYVQESILTYHSLEGYSDARIEIFLEGQGNTAFFHLVRDVGTISQGEISMVSTIIHEQLGNILVMDHDDDGVYMDMDLAGEPAQEEFIDHMITTLKAGRLADRMVGVREDGRVMVFNR